MLKLNNNIQSEIIFMTMEEMVHEDSLFMANGIYLIITLFYLLI